MTSCIYTGYQAPATPMASVLSVCDANPLVAEGDLFLDLVPEMQYTMPEYA